METDVLGRPLQPPATLSALRQALASLPDDKRGALVLIAESSGTGAHQTTTTRAHLAAKLADGWKVAAGGGVVWSTSPPDAGPPRWDAAVSVERSW